MDSKQKIIEVNSSSIIDLKAELFRKQAEVRQKQATTNAETDAIEANDDELYNKNLHQASKLPKKLAEISSHLDDKKPNKKRKEPEISADELAKRREEEKAWEQSRLKLEKKARLYEQMSKGQVIVGEDDKEDVLVDFEQKSKLNLNYPMDNFEDRDDEDEGDNDLVEWVDEFGRTRMVPKQDLEELERNKTQNNEYGDNWSTNSGLLSEDMKCEIERREWEEKTRAEMTDSRQTPHDIHYQHVREGEVRDHGVAFFAFSEDEETRSKQRAMLDNLRAETAAKKLEKQRIKDRRKQMARERLAKIAARKGIQLPEEDETSDQEDEKPSETTLPVKIQKANSEMASETNNWPQVSRLREWDRGKEGVHSVRSPPRRVLFYSQETYMEKQRDERKNEFAPPSSYYEQPRKSSRHNPPENQQLKKSCTQQSSTSTPQASNLSTQDVSDFISQIRNIVDK